MAQIVSPSEWRAARAELSAKENEAFKQWDDMILKRQELPMVEIPNPDQIKFDAPGGKKLSMLDLFSGRRQLIIYNFMLYDNVEDPCVWCSFGMDNVTSHLGHLHSRDTSFVVVAPASVEKIEKDKSRMGWTFPFYSCKTTIADAGGKDVERSWKTGSGHAGYESFLKDGDKVFHTYSAENRPTEPVMSTIALLDMTKLGRQEGGEERVFPLHDTYKA